MHRRLLSLLAAAALVVMAPACAGSDPATAPTVAPSTAVPTTQPGDADLSCARPGVVRPNCGVAPEAAGDRGGALQYTVWALLVVGLAIVFTVVFRSARRTDVAKQHEVGDRNWS